MSDVSILKALLAALRSRDRRPDPGRRSQRFVISTPAKIRAADTVGAKWEPAMLDDISLGGARVHATVALAPKAHIDVKLPLGAAGEIPVRAMVIYAKRKRKGMHDEYGLRFVDLSYDRYRVLIDFINEREGASKAGARHPQSSRRA